MLHLGEDPMMTCAGSYSVPLLYVAKKLFIDNQYNFLIEIAWNPRDMEGIDYRGAYPSTA